MAKNFYVLAAALLLFSLVFAGFFFAHRTPDPSLPGEAATWRILALLFFLGAALTALAGTVTDLFEQVSRRHESRKRRIPPTR
jgi:hypothetical protein